MNMKKFLVISILLVLVFTLSNVGTRNYIQAQTLEANLTLEDGITTPGYPLSVDVILNSSELIKGFTIGFSFDGDIFPDAEILDPGLGIPSNWVSACNLAGPGDLRCVGVDLSGVGFIFSGEVLFSIDFTVADLASLGSFSVSVGEVTILASATESLLVNTFDSNITIVPCGDFALPHNGVADIGDVISMLQVLIGKGEITPLQLVLGDVGVGGTKGVIDIFDVFAVVYSIVGIIDIDGCGV